MSTRIETDPIVTEALKNRHAEDIWLVECPDCGEPSYWNQGSHATCRLCDKDLSDLTDDAFTLADYWEQATYPCDEPERSYEAGKEQEKS